MNHKTWLAMWLLAVGAGCGVSSAEVELTGEEVALEDDSFELSTTKDTFLIARRDSRRCVSPMCGGYWVKDLNSTMQERYVSAFDFSESSLPDSAQDAVRGAPDHQLVVFGRLGPKESRFDTRTLLVKRAWRGMPGKTFGPSERFYGVFPTKIACLTTPCAYLQTTRLNRATGHTMSTDVDVSAALAMLVDEQWMRSRVFSGKTVIAGTIVRKNRHVTVTASQVFVELPDRVVPCPIARPPRCPSGQLASFERTADRCTLPTGQCTPPGVCAYYVPACDEGYRQVSWMNICPRYACEPEFLEE
ncbi:MAG: hypothetical protein JNJ54_05135 [Myxococcaceae bacterium]|nr:hypothetical protein [Myxococcaceae bacterium]